MVLGLSLGRGGLGLGLGLEWSGLGLEWSGLGLISVSDDEVSVSVSVSDSEAETPSLPQQEVLQRSEHTSRPTRKRLGTICARGLRFLGYFPNITNLSAKFLASQYM